LNNKKLFRQGELLVSNIRQPLHPCLKESVNCQLFGFRNPYAENISRQNFFSLTAPTSTNLTLRPLSYADVNQQFNLLI